MTRTLIDFGSDCIPFFSGINTSNIPHKNIERSVVTHYDTVIKEVKSLPHQEVDEGVKKILLLIGLYIDI